MMWVLYLFLSLILMSGVEYAAHRWTMHRRFGPLDRWLPGVYRNHAILHHGVYYRTFDHEPDVIGRDINIELPDRWKMGLAVSPLVAALACMDVRLAVVFSAVYAIHHATWNRVHSEMHRPLHPWWRYTRLFAFYERWHLVHHAHVNRNFAILLPFWDFVLGTFYRRRV